jgi:hypothetical protein
MGLLMVLQLAVLCSVVYWAASLAVEKKISSLSSQGCHAIREEKHRDRRLDD